MHTGMCENEGAAGELPKGGNQCLIILITRTPYILFSLSAHNSGTIFVLDFYFLFLCI